AAQSEKLLSLVTRFKVKEGTQPRAHEAAPAAASSVKEKVAEKSEKPVIKKKVKINKTQKEGDDRSEEVLRIG
ncbi:MAG: hypothetical protein JNN05_06000, partial [Candidatus Omnitrophica bacterium]|nr:hypothetical protein [Candidatus Omnitrophota bacterium]